MNDFLITINITLRSWVDNRRYYANFTPTDYSMKFARKAWLELAGPWPKEREGRKAILIELNPDYVKLQYQRCQHGIGLPL